MKMEPFVRDRIIRNTILSLFIYLLPILLMVLTFWATGQKPWANYHPSAEVAKHRSY